MHIQEICTDKMDSAVLRCAHYYYYIILLLILILELIIKHRDQKSRLISLILDTKFMLSFIKNGIKR